jgi:1-acyl-sn-glycerol-3-phosphate acyltransferase
MRPAAPMGTMTLMAYSYSRGWRGLTIGVVPAVSIALVRRDWQGTEHVPRAGGLIIAANHVSEADPLALAHFLWKCGRYPVFLTKSTLFGGGLVGRVVTGTGQIPVRRDTTGAVTALADAEAALAAGQCIVIYP